ncbi:hypothetical protein [Pseudonocardia lacus]|uniref:hypothetical protein n=1 Tax=Pseudonocardia lacus TaxID=2835865 RepID=UPI001BDC74AE|nr:hypothetical protein [Pseudonocardia lacus]
MAFQEKRAWITLATTVGTYVAYLAILLVGAGGGPLTAVPYIAALLWCVGISIGATTVLIAVAAFAAPEDADVVDARDREIGRFGNHLDRWSVVLGAAGALVLAMVEADHFWIANAIYLAFTLSSLLDSAARILAYRRGVPVW